MAQQLLSASPASHGSSENDFGVGRFLISALMPRCPGSILQVLGPDVKLAVGKEFAGGAHFGHPTRLTFDLFMRDELSLFDFERSGSHVTFGREKVKYGRLALNIPDGQGFAAVSALIDRMQKPDGLPVQRPLPFLHIDYRFVRRRVRKCSFPSLPQKRTKRLQVSIKREFFRSPGCVDAAEAE